MTQEPADFCPYCGTRLTSRRIDGQDRKYCADCDRPIFHNPVPCTDVTVVDGDQALFIERAAPPGAGEWTVPGGHVEADEHPRDAAVRELREETSVSAEPEHLTLVETDLLDSTRGKYVLNVGFAVPVAETTGTPTAKSDAADARFFSLDEVAAAAGHEFRSHVSDRIEAALDAL